eukprot:CAMPEP_0183708482 /NCGR_PEP_ID=MMETSP0737-20130205/4795_1 /TAXON_ID=385413 /ORGANISM="Thalassiosira miniscula, Strain CCMP1093" /LENGTH=785 /DNA_ID=CAMNT_0025936375 /DNA_START=174 /DNA_END=2531 /DNA_ORIENTATION=+
MPNIWSQLSRAWVKDFLPQPSAVSDESSSVIRQALQRTLPLLSEDPASVPFVCRYRSDVINPLTTKQVHQLSDYIQKHDSLSSLRNKILEQLRKSDGDNSSTISRVETSVSKTELDDIYAPFKPPSKGSLEDRIQKEYPNLVSAVEELWENWGTSDVDSKLLKKLRPMDKAATLLANRIAADVDVMDALMDYCNRQCKVKIKQASNSGDKKKKTKNSKASSSSFETYHDYQNKVCLLRDHQVLAIRRGVDQKELRLSFDIDDCRADQIIRKAAFSNKQNHQLYREARKDAWTRLLRKRCTSRLWKEVSKRAEERSIHVFCDNLRKALLAPPATMTNQKAILSLDPGFQAGIKCAILSNEGKVVCLDTVKFMGSAKNRGKEKLVSLLDKVEELSGNSKIPVVLGNGHGTREARQLLEEAASEGEMETELHLTSEAGASVWSVTEMANEEFPNETPAAIAAVSIGRRFLNPLNELVKIPPKSLGLGMYQHDLSEKVLDEKLSLTSIDAVAEVGVDVNSCSLAILGKVPSLTPKLCTKIMASRPLKSRNDLMNISGLGPKTFQNCAAFVRVSGGKESLDATLVHPESYDLARWLLKELRWKLSESESIKSMSGEEQKENWKEVAKKAAGTFHFSEDRVLTVIDHLYFSIMSPDPRLRKEAEVLETTKIGSTKGCSSLPPNASTIDKLGECKLPLRSIIGTVRNVVDFGAFVDFGLENDGLVHRSKMGNVSLESLLVGQEIGVDILGVAKNNKISLGLTGLDFPAVTQDSKRPRKLETNKPQRKKQRRK